MKTAYYTFTTWKDSAMAAGFDGAADEGRRGVMVRQSGRRTGPEEDKVIDLTAWRAASLEPLEAGEEDWDDAEQEPAGPAPRLRKSRRALPAAELASTLSVAAAALALIVRVLTF